MILEALQLEPPAKLFSTEDMSKMLRKFRADSVAYTPVNGVTYLLNNPSDDPFLQIQMIKRCLIAPRISSDAFCQLINAANHESETKLSSFSRQHAASYKDNNHLKEALLAYRDGGDLELFSRVTLYKAIAPKDLIALMESVTPNQRQALKKLIIQLLKTEGSDLLDLLQVRHQNGLKTHLEWLLRVSQSGRCNQDTDTYVHQYLPLMKRKQPKVSKQGMFAEGVELSVITTLPQSNVNPIKKG